MSKRYGRKQRQKQKEKEKLLSFSESTSKPTVGTEPLPMKPPVSTTGWTKDWWVSDYGKKLEGKSVSSYWTSRVDDTWWWGNSYGNRKKDDDQDFDGIISSVRRSANIVTNAEKVGGEERELTTKWAVSDSDRNTAKGKDVFLSPTVVDRSHTMRKDWTDDERTDVLIGEALVQSTMKHTITPEVEDAMCVGSGTEIGRLENEMWTISEHLFAETEVLKNYPGFKGYFASNREYYTGKGVKESFEKSLVKEVDPMKATVGLMWELLHPQDELKAPKDVREFLGWSKNRLSGESTSAGRAAASQEIVRKAYEIWKNKGDGKNPVNPQKSIAESFIDGIGISETGRDEVMDIQTKTPVMSSPKGESQKDAHYLPHNLDGVDWYGGTIDYKVQPTIGGNSIYESCVKKLGPLIREVRNKMKIRAEEQKLIEHALRKGRIDEGSLYKLAFNNFDFKDDKIFEQEEIISMPKVAFGFLVDESGSMGSGTRIQSARDVAIVLANACLGLEGISFGVFGHTADHTYHGGTARDMAIHHYYTPEHQQISSMGRMRAFSNNLDGYAIAHVSKLMTKFYANCTTKILVHISDGYPAGDEYGGGEAMDHVGGVSKLCKAKGIKVIGIGIEGAFSQADGIKMYGAGNFAVLSGTAGLQNIVTNLIVRVASVRT